MNLLDKFKGCLVGGAVGDALGYAVEFLDVKDICDIHGSSGITDYQLINGVAQISDDTQMTLFTASGLLMGEPYMKNISLCYRDWLLTQFGIFPLKNEETVSPLVEVKELFSSRAPGGTCIYAIREGAWGTPEDPINDSKGCGGIMRVAPAGLFFKDAEVAADMGAKAAALTHGHQLGYIPAAALAHIINQVTYNDDISLMDAVLNTRAYIAEKYRDLESTAYQLELIDLAIKLSKKDTDYRKALPLLGQGWVAEETLAIAIYCALKFQDDFEAAMIASVNHDGDSDSTGAVTGNILGAYLGIGAIPDKFLKDLELKDLILDMADQLYKKCSK